VAGPVVVRRGAQVFVVGRPPSPPVDYSLGIERFLEVDRDTGVDPLPVPLLEALVTLPPAVTLSADSESFASALGARLGRAVAVAGTPELRAVRAALPLPAPDDERRTLLGVARNALERVLRTPEEVLITLTREEERVERAVGREARAAESLLVVPGSALAEYSRQWTGVRASLEQHHAMLEDLVRVHARAVAPNLSAVVGERAAARLISEAGGVAALARMRAGRIQLLGTRRRPSPERGPRYGILYRAVGMAEVPAGRRGAYARSLGAMAAIAIRADATTHSSISRALVARRDRRIAQLRSRGG
jgi:snoRNA binding domain, fibrillarin